MTYFYCKVKNSLAERREEGQGTIEYLGIAVVIAIVVISLAAFFRNDGTDAIEGALSNIIERVSSTFAGEGD